ncbi:MAG: YceI family protein [bacterium]
MKRTIYALGILLTLFHSGANAQSKYFTKSANIKFDASGTVEEILAENKKATFVLDTKTSAVEMGILMKAFEFKRALMQEHFNENYAESDKFPKATYKGKVTNLSNVEFRVNGTYLVKMVGKLTMHGVTKDVPATGGIQVADGKVSGYANLQILLSDFGIEIPGLVKDKISNKVTITVKVWLDPLP